MDLVLSLKRWLSKPVIVDSGIDRPFKLRRLSLLLLAGGWAVFLAACLVALWARSQGLPIATFSDLFAEIPADGLSWSVHLGYVAGGVVFYLGLVSVMAFDRRDGIPIFMPEEGH